MLGKKAIQDKEGTPRSDGLLRPSKGKEKENRRTKQKKRTDVVTRRELLLYFLNGCYADGRQEVVSSL